MKILVAAILLILLALVGVQIYSFLKQQRDLSQTLADVQNRLAKARQDEASLTATMQYLQNPVNLTKELRSQFNYKKPGETMIVIVPGASSTTFPAASNGRISIPRRPRTRSICSTFPRL